MKQKNLFFLLLALTFWSLMSSCEYYAYEADLQVNVKGALSGNPREGILVQLFNTREDAERLVYPVSPVLVTDQWGEVFFFGLEPGINYYVRIDGIIQTNIKRTNRMNNGTNTVTVRLL